MQASVISHYCWPVISATLHDWVLNLTIKPREREANNEQLYIKTLEINF
jgi:hypothetical protein